MKKRPTQGKPGQSLIEFALIGVVLFGVLMGIIDAGRLLFAYSVVTHAAQEGSRYAMVRPRDVLGPSEATRIATSIAATPTLAQHSYTADQVVASDTDCNAFGKTREKSFGLNQSDIQIAVWYDKGDDTPIAVPANAATPYLESAAIAGNRAVVEASYHFDFIVPYFSMFLPNGINVKMRAARTIVSAGDQPNNCTLNFTPGPTYTPTPTLVPSATYTRTATPSVTLTATPVCALSNPGACRLPAGNNTPADWQAWVTVQGYQPDYVVRAYMNSVYYTMSCTSSGYCTYSSPSGTGVALRRYSLTISVAPNGYSCTPGRRTINWGTDCYVTPTSTPTYTKTPTRTPSRTSTPTRTFTRTNTPTITPTFTKTNTPTSTPTFTKTNTSTPTRTNTHTSTPTPTPTPCPLIISVSAVRDNTGTYNKAIQPQAIVRDQQGRTISGLTVTASVSGSGEVITLTEVSAGTYRACSGVNYTGNRTVTFSVTGGSCGTNVNYSPSQSISTSIGTISACP